MIAKRFWIVVALLAVLYNILRFGILSATAFRNWRMARDADRSRLRGSGSQ